MTKRPTTHGPPFLDAHRPQDTGEELEAGEPEALTGPLVLEHLEQRLAEPVDPEGPDYLAGPV